MLVRNNIIQVFSVLPTQVKQMKTGRELAPIAHIQTVLGDGFEGLD